jgi:hypothetical protein
VHGLTEQCSALHLLPQCLQTPVVEGHRLLDKPLTPSATGNSPAPLPRKKENAELTIGGRNEVGTDGSNSRVWA